ncbi:MAG: prephenate dehydrogenase [Oscillochloridaceae bacterium umkhey_bin13]
MTKIAIIGLGLLGASLGMALRSADAKESPLGPVEVWGWDRDPKAIKEARVRLAIDREVRTLPEAVRDANLVVLATPVQAIRELLVQLGSLLPEGSVVTDVASTKAAVMEWAAQLPNGITFIGGHPMAGKEQSGTAAADSELLTGAIYCLTVSHRAPQQAVELVEAMVRTAGARPYYIDATEHDAYVAGISHLPMLLSVGLTTITGQSPAWKELAPLAATGFRDVSRLASGDPEMHRDILLTNAAGLDRWIDAMIRFLVTTRDQLAAGDSETIETMLREAKAHRDEWLASRPNLRPGEADFLQQPEIERPNLLTFRRPGRK